MGCSESKDADPQLQARLSAAKGQKSPATAPRRDRGSPRPPPPPPHHHHQEEGGTVPRTYFSPPRDVDRLYGTTEYDGASRCSPRPPLKPQLRQNEHPTEMIEVALQLQGAHVAELATHFRALCAALQVGDRDCAAGAKGMAAEALLFAGRRAQITGSQFSLSARWITKASLGQIKVSEGCVIEGTAAAEHFEDVLDLRALPIKELTELCIEPHHHQHCRIQGPHFDVILVGVTLEQLQPEHFILPAPGSDIREKLTSPPPGRRSGSGGSGPSARRSPIVVEAGAAEHFKLDRCDKLDLRGLGIPCFADLCISEEPGGCTILEWPLPEAEAAERRRDADDRHIHTTQQLCIRHGVHDLFVLLRQFNCEVVMWSAADAETVNAIWAAVDPTGVTSHVLPREVWQRGPHD
eukprot:gene24280-28208_t